MPRAGRRRHRPPEVLRRVYGNRVRRILDAILSFLPSPPPSPDSCPYGRCLRCVPAGERKSWLVRRGDPADYRQLLTRGFAVLHKTAPPFPADFDPRQLHDHRQIVQSSLKEPWRSPSSSFKYELVDSKSSLDNLCDSAWHLLSMRVGDIIMLHLLKFSSIFLPLLTNKYFEVNGSSRSNFYPCPKDKVTEVRKHDFSSTNVLSQGPKNSGVKRVENMGDSGDYVLSDSLATKKRTRPSSWQRRRQQKNMCSYTSDAGLVHCERIVNCSSGPKNNGVRSVENIRDSGCPDLVVLHATKKRTRPWQKSKHKRNMCFYTSDTTLAHCGRTINCSSDYSSELLPNNTRHCFDSLTCSGEKSSNDDYKKDPQALGKKLYG